MSSPSTTSVRRRIALATGAGALVLLGGAGVAYAASSIDDSVETGWSTVVEADPAAVGGDAQSRDSQSRATRTAPTRPARASGPGPRRSQPRHPQPVGPEPGR